MSTTSQNRELFLADYYKYREGQAVPKKPNEDVLKRTISNINKSPSLYFHILKRERPKFFNPYMVYTFEISTEPYDIKNADAFKSLVLLKAEFTSHEYKKSDLPSLKAIHVSKRKVYNRLNSLYFRIINYCADYTLRGHDVYYSSLEQDNETLKLFSFRNPSNPTIFIKDIPAIEEPEEMDYIKYKKFR